MLVICHPRSGSKYMAKLLQSLGLYVKHEKMGEDGISYWKLSFYNPKKIKRKFNTIIHVVRNPIKVVESVYFTENVRKSMLFRERYIPILKKLRGVDDMISYSIVSVVKWCKLIHDKSHVDKWIKVEEAEEKLPIFLNRQFIKTLPSKKTNSRKHPTLNLENHKLYGYLEEHANKYGYKIS